MKATKGPRTRVGVAADCRRLASGILTHLDRDVVTGGRIAGRDFYGGAFALWLATLLDAPDALPGLEETVLAAQDPPSGRYHTEFVLFALGMRAVRSGDPGHREAFDSLAARRRFAHGRVANWRLLRSAARLLIGGRAQAGLAAAEVASVLAGNTTRSGFVSDKRGRPSLQYHAFSVFLLGHLAEHGLPWCRRPFDRGVAALSRLVLPSGEMNYLGRGALQSFGYASAVAALAAHHRLFAAGDSLGLADRVVRYLAAFRTDDGAVPLVCSARGTDRDGAEPPSGWWSYNNHSDYVAFTGALLAHAAAGLERPPTADGVRGDGVPVPRRGRQAGAGVPVIPGTRQVSSGNYHAVVGVPRPGVSGGQPFPFLEVAGRHPLPLFGGEQETSDRYGGQTLPLPLVDVDGEPRSLASLLRWRLHRDRLVGTGAWGHFTRGFDFRADGITVVDEITPRRGSRMAAVAQLSLYRDGARAEEDGRQVRVPGGVLLRCSEPLALAPEVALSPGGALCFLRAPGRDLEAGRTLRVETELVVG